MCFHLWQMWQNYIGSITCIVIPSTENCPGWAWLTHRCLIKTPLHPNQLFSPASPSSPHEAVISQLSVAMGSHHTEHENCSTRSGTLDLGTLPTSITTGATVTESKPSRPTPIYPSSYLRTHWKGSSEGDITVRLPLGVTHCCLLNCQELRCPIKGPHKMGSTDLL